MHSPLNDQWYIVYHGFNKPNGIKMGDVAGYNREVCIDQLIFDEPGAVIQVQPITNGILDHED